MPTVESLRVSQRHYCVDSLFGLAFGTCSWHADGAHSRLLYDNVSK